MLGVDEEETEEMKQTEKKKRKKEAKGFKKLKTKIDSHFNHRYQTQVFTKRNLDKSMAIEGAFHSDYNYHSLAITKQVVNLIFYFFLIKI